MKKFIKKLFKISLYSIGGLFLLGIIAAACSDEEVEKTKKEPIKVEAKKETPKKEEVNKEIIKKDNRKKEVKQVIDKMLAMDKNFEPKWNAVVDAMSKNDRYKTYEASALAHAEAKRIWLEFNKVEIPKGLDKEVEDNLKAAKEELQLVYFMKKEAIESMQEFLDNNKPSDLQKFKDKTTSSSSYMFSASAKLVKVKQLVGLELE